MTRMPFLAARRLARDDRGSYAIETAFILPVFLMLLVGIFDIGMQMYAKAVLNGAVEYAARANTLEGNSSDQTVIDTLVRDRVQDVVPFGQLEFSRLNYQDFNTVGQPEEFTDTNRNGVRDAGECFQDANGNGMWDADRGRAGQGGANDVVLYRVSLTFDRIFPLWKMLKQPRETTIQVATVLRNQPYANQTNPTVVRCT